MIININIGIVNAQIVNIYIITCVFVFIVFIQCYMVDIQYEFMFYAFVDIDFICYLEYLHSCQCCCITVIVGDIVTSTPTIGFV